eukprot:TRINITY_DN19290_c0_g1_i1.p1 TRINITY_DN19290_c0_g1~~TRINITY_DN19290_c0_g1_i1.p1  ORF type:complete len:1324 (-),score=204.85 TRINITY_DN19290_c0_g1_i1:32-4003(-)
MEELHNQHPPEQGHAMRFQPTPPPLPLPLPLLFSSPKQSPRSRDSLSTVEVVSRLPDSGVEGSSSSSLVPSENHDRSKPTHDQTSAQIEVLERRLLLLEQQYLVHARPHSKLDEQTSRPVDSERQPPRAQERAAPSKASSGSIRSARACGAGRSSAAAAAAEPAASNPATAVSDLDMGQDPRSSEDEIQGPSLFLHLRHPEHASSSDKRQLAENWERSNAETADPEGGLRDGVSEEPGQEATELNYRCQELGLQPRNESSLDSHCKAEKPLEHTALRAEEADQIMKRELRKIDDSNVPNELPLLGQRDEDTEQHQRASKSQVRRPQQQQQEKEALRRNELLPFGRPSFNSQQLGVLMPVKVRGANTAKQVGQIAAKMHEGSLDTARLERALRRLQQQQHQQLPPSDDQPSYTGNGAGANISPSQEKVLVKDLEPVLEETGRERPERVSRRARLLLERSSCAPVASQFKISEGQDADVSQAVRASTSNREDSSVKSRQQHCNKSTLQRASSLPNCKAIQSQQSNSKHMGITIYGSGVDIHTANIRPNGPAVREEAVIAHETKQSWHSNATEITQHSHNSHAAMTQHSHSNRAAPSQQPYSSAHYQSLHAQLGQATSNINALSREVEPPLSVQAASETMLDTDVLHEESTLQHILQTDTDVIHDALNLRHYLRTDADVASEDTTDVTCGYNVLDAVPGPVAVATSPHWQTHCQDRGHLAEAKQLSKTSQPTCFLRDANPEQSQRQGAQSLGESPLAGVEAEGPPPKVPLLGHAAAAVTTGTPLQLASELEGPVPRVPLLGHGRPAASKTPLKQQQPVPESRFTSRSSRPASIVKAALVANPITTAAVKLPLARCKSKPVEEWQENDVCEWLIEEASAPVGITRVVHDNAITGNVLLSLTEDDVDTLHVEKFGHRRLLLLAAQDIRSAISSRRPNQPNLPNAQDIFSSHEKKLAQLDDEHRAEHKHVAQDAKDGSGGDGACNEQQTAQHHTDQKALPSQSLQPPQKKLCEAGLPNRPRSAELPVHRGPSSPMLAAPPCAPAVTALSACRAIPRGASVRVPGAVALRSGSTLSPRSSSTSSGVPCRNLEQRKIHLVQAHAAAPALACPAFSQAVREAEVSQLLSPRYAAVVAARTTIATTSSGGALTPRVAGTPCLRALSGPPGGTAGVRNHRSQHPQLVCSWQYQQQTAAFPIFSTPPTPAPPARMAFCTAPVPAPMEPVAVAGGLCGPQRPHSQERGCQTAPHAATSYPGMVQPPSEHSNAKVCSRTSLADADLDGGRCAALTPRVLTPGGLSAEASAGRAAYIARFGHRTMVRPRSGHLSSPRP